MEAIKKGRAEGLHQVSNALFEKATQGNVTAMIYYLKVRHRDNWGENQPAALKEMLPVKSMSLWSVSHYDFPQRDTKEMELIAVFITR